MQTHTELFPVLTEAMEEVPPYSLSSTLFQQEEQSGVTYRIPALLYLPPPTPSWPLQRSGPQSEMRMLPAWCSDEG